MKNTLRVLFLVLISLSLNAQDFDIKEVGQIYDLQHVTPYFSYMSQSVDLGDITLSKEEVEEDTEEFKMATFVIKDDKTYHRYLLVTDDGIRMRREKESNSYFEIPNEKVESVKFDEKPDSLVYFNFKENDIKSVLKDVDYFNYAYENDSLIFYKREYITSIIDMTFYGQNSLDPMVKDGFMVGERDISYPLYLIEKKTDGKLFYFEMNASSPYVAKRDRKNKESLEVLFFDYPNLKKLIPNSTEHTKKALPILISLLNIKSSGDQLYLNNNWDVIIKDTTDYSYKITVNNDDNTSLSLTVLNKNNQEIMGGYYHKSNGDFMWDSYTWYDKDGIKIKHLTKTKDMYSGKETNFYKEYNTNGVEVINYTVSSKGQVKYTMVVDKNMNAIDPRKEVTTLLYDNYFDKDLNLSFKKNKLKRAYYKEESNRYIFVKTDKRDASWKKKSKIDKELNELVIEQKLNFNEILGDDESKKVLVKFVIDKTGKITEFELLNNDDKFIKLSSVLEEFFLNKEYFKPASVIEKKAKLEVNQMLIMPLVIRMN